MKIAFIGQKGIPAISGGIEKHAEDLAVALVERGHDVIVYTRPNYTNPNLKEYKGVRLISLPSLATKNLDAITHTFLAVLDLIRRDVDIIHFHAIGPSSLIWLAKLLKPNTKVVATFHCQDYFHQKWSWFARLYLRFGEYVACTGANKTIAVSKTLAGYVSLAYDRDATYIPNGVHEVSIEEPELIKQFSLEKGKYILAVSRLVRHKGVHHLIKAFHNLDTDKKLVIVGDGAFTDEYVSEIKNMAAEDSRIIMTGAQKGQMLAELFSNAALFVQPSESEGLSIALLEAMSYGRAALVSDISENKEAIGEYGFTFKSRDVENLTKQLSTLLSNEQLLVQVGAQAQARMINEYNWSMITDNTEQVYAELIAEAFSGRVERRKAFARLATFI